LNTIFFQYTLKLTWRLYNCSWSCRANCNNKDV